MQAIGGQFFLTKRLRIRGWEMVIFIHLSDTDDEELQNNYKLAYLSEKNEGCLSA